MGRESKEGLWDRREPKRWEGTGEGDCGIEERQKCREGEERGIVG